MKLNTLINLSFLLLGQIAISQNIGLAIKLLEQHALGGYSGTVLLSHKDQVVLSEGYGNTSSSNTQKITPETLFNIASITKSFTAVGILQLYEEGKILLTAPIHNYLDGVPKDKESITVHQLLTHSSGMPQGYVNIGVKESEKAKKNLLKEKLKSDPGTSFGYSNLNYELLSLIIEKVSGQLYEDYIRQNILNPVGMTHTLFWDEVDHHDELAVAQKIEKFRKPHQEKLCHHRLKLYQYQ